MGRMGTILVGLLLLLGWAPGARALISEGRPGVPYFAHPLFVDVKKTDGEQVTWVTLAYGDRREGSLECRNVIDVFQGRQLFRTVPEKSWVLVDYQLQSIAITDGFAGDADVSRVVPCQGPEACRQLSAEMAKDPQEQSRRAGQARPPQTKKADFGDLNERLEAGRALVKAARCRGCHTIEGFGAAHAPSLTWKRYKYEPGWLEHFLAAPYRMRPALGDLMMLRFTSPNASPSLQESELQIVADYLPQAAWTRVPNDRYRGEAWPAYDCFSCHTRLYREQPLGFRPTPVPAVIRERVADTPTVEICFSCHAFGDLHVKTTRERTASPYLFAPDLVLSMEKLEINYLVNFVHDPAYLQPGAAMPRLDFDDRQFADLRALVAQVKAAIAGGIMRPVHVPYLMEKRRDQSGP